MKFSPEERFGIFAQSKDKKYFLRGKIWIISSEHIYELFPQRKDKYGIFPQSKDKKFFPRGKIWNISGCIYLASSLIEGIEFYRHSKVWQIQATSLTAE